MGAGLSSPFDRCSKARSLGSGRRPEVAMRHRLAGALSLRLQALGHGPVIPGESAVLGMPAETDQPTELGRCQALRLCPPLVSRSPLAESDVVEGHEGP